MHTLLIIHKMTSVGEIQRSFLFSFEQKQKTHSPTDVTHLELLLRFLSYPRAHNQVLLQVGSSRWSTKENNQIPANMKK